MTTGIACEGQRYGLSGERCEGLAPAETGVCSGCCAEARSMGKTIEKLGVLEQWQRALVA